MSAVLARLAEADRTTPLFVSAGGVATAGDIRAMAAHALGRIGGGEGRLYAFTQSASALAAALLTAARAGRTLAILPQAQPGYLADLGVDERDLLTELGAAPTLVPDGADAPLAAPAGPPLPLEFFTSGSTGAPKILPKTMAMLEAEIAVWAELFATVEEIRRQVRAIEGTVSHQHVYGMLFRLLFPLMTGVPGGDRAALAWEELEGRIGAGVMLVTSPAHLTRLPPALALPAGPPAQVLSSGQLLPFEAAQATARLFGRAPLEIFGSTETGGVAWRLREADAAPWRPLPGVIVAGDEDDVLQVRSPFLRAGETVTMGDRAAFLSDGTFVLRGRVDRVEKIEGKRVSLTRVEEALAQLPEISEAAALSLPARRESLGCVAVLSEEGRRRLAALGPFRLSRALRGALAASLEPAERPKHWRFPDRMPVNAQGKRVLADLRQLFDADSWLTALGARIHARDETTARLSFELDPDLVFFRGHFPGRAIMPGIAQVHLAARLAAEIWDEELDAANLTQVKFKRLLRPGHRVELELERQPGRVRFRLTQGVEVASEGLIGAA